MSLKVAKFGGSSLADANQIKKVKDIIFSDKNYRYIVVSAPGKRYENDTKITDLLYLCHAHIKHSVPYNELFDIIKNRFIDIVDNLGLSIDINYHLENIKERINKYESVDYIASRGEYLNGLILAEYLGYDFIDPTEIIFFDEYGSFDAKKTQEAVSKRLQKHKYAVIPGFYGCTPNGKIKTFSRGGSDITGAIIAQAVKAKVYENWTDVSGFLMADPKIIDNPKRIEKITYDELRELSYMGAKVLHEDTIFPVREANIPVNIRNTNEPENPGTIIFNDKNYNIRKNSITGIAGKKDFTVIAIQKNFMNSDIGFVRKILSILEANSIPFEHLPSGIDNISLVIESSKLENKIDKIINEINKQCKPDSIDIYENIALIATVGHGMAYTPGIAAKLFSAVAKANVNVRMIDQGSSEINIIIGVENKDFEKAVKAIYNAFVN
ncbi:aspartate kinase [Caminicella sporogenes DSM 14501]|uniref:Aspartokinase n=1 Tax=Caminicella sporogenes DSM 14501 TaxID=1121266 RepID=A0A1M6NJ34_9FIRM|nr:aspartate kinase [Caminicella sporogenes]RKD22189.1 aspartate kinase [Caminicella sporogenes]SHJ95552.1 aspartate kinase [Caminicella sporogenes DSM 14501]